MRLRSTRQWQRKRVSASSYLAFNPPLAWLPLALRSSTVRDRAFASVSRGDYDSSGGIQPGKAFVVALDGTTLQPLSTVDLLQHPELFKPGGGDAILLNPPPRPSALNVTVDTRRVRFQWNDSGDATHFQLEIGSRSGQADLGVLVIQSATTLQAENAPSGRYFVRVRAVNDVGVSLASNEVIVLSLRIRRDSTAWISAGESFGLPPAFRRTVPLSWPGFPLSSRGADESRSRRDSDGSASQNRLRLLVPRQRCLEVVRRRRDAE